MELTAEHSSPDALLVRQRLTHRRHRRGQPLPARRRPQPEQPYADPDRVHPLGQHLYWLVCFAASSVVVLLGVDFGRLFVIPGPWFKAPEPFIESMVHWDGAYFLGIAGTGYSYTPGRPSTVHFFPFYPLVGWCVMKLTGLSSQPALVVLSHLCFAASLYLLGRYIRGRYGAEHNGACPAALLTLSFLPAGFFFHMCYTESLFLLLCIIHLHLMERRAHPVLPALVVGMAVATRAVGVGLLAPLLLYLAHYARRPKAFLGWCTLCLPLATSGLIIYGVYCQWAFGDALATVRDRATLWALRPLPALPEKLLALATFQPVWEIFVPSSGAYWGRFATRALVPFSLYVANPVYFVAALVLVGLGRWKRWLNSYETLAALGLLLVPYWTVGYEGQMVSMARYVVVIPAVYLVAGRLLAKLPPVVGGCMLALSGLFLAMYAALFARWYWLV
jgi:Mannosyltransferase (PIG-V)